MCRRWLFVDYCHRHMRGRLAGLKFDKYSQEFSPEIINDVIFIDFIFLRFAYGVIRKSSKKSIDSMKISPLCPVRADQTSVSVAPIANHVVANCHLVIRTTEERCDILGREPCIDEMMQQIRIRLLALSRTGGTQELSSLRRLFTHLYAMHAEAKHSGVHLSVHEAAPIGLNLPLWFDVDWQVIEKACGQLTKLTYSEIRRQGASLINRFMTELSDIVLTASEAEMAAILAGVVAPLKDYHRPPQRRWQAIDSTTLGQLVEQLALKGCGATQVTLSRRPFNYRQLAALMARVIWMTGLRSVELFHFQLLSPHPQKPIEPILSHPLAAYRNAHLVPLSIDASSIYPAIMIVDTAKSRCASPHIDNRQRALIIRGLEPDQWVDIVIASNLRSLGLSQQRIQSIRLTCSRLVRQASKVAFPNRRDPIGLHNLRHAFADGARATMTRAEAAALTGHTSPHTLKGYGKRFHSKSNAGFTRWFPQPDPERVKQLERVWEVTQKPMPVLTGQVKPEPPQPRLQLGDH